MLERLVVNLLNKYLGKYIQDLDAEKINIGTLNGEVELTDLKLKQEALFELDLPVEVKAGCVGRIHIKIPWRNISAQSVVIHVNDVLILVGPIKDRNFDQELEKRLNRAEKAMKLKQIEQLKGFERDDSDDLGLGFWEKMSVTVTNNIQLYISNIHVCYEDTTTNPDCPFACGLVLHNLSAETTNSKWKSAHDDGNSSSVFKLIKLESLSLYWNPLCNRQCLTKNYLHTNNWKTIMKKGLETFSNNGEDFDFILKPISAKVKIIMSKSNEAKVPKLLVDFVLQDVAIQFSRQQYLSILALHESFQYMRVNRRYFCYHPGVPIKGHVQEWWYYALIALVDQQMKPCSWQNIQRYRKSYKQYRDLYRKRLNKPLDAELRVDLLKLEDKLDVTSIMLAREEARIQFAKEEPQKAVRKKVPKPWWKIWPSEDTGELEEWFIPNERDYVPWTKLMADERQQLYDAIGYTEEFASDKPKQYIEHKLNLTFANCTLSLLNYSQEISVLTLTQFLLSVDTRPAAQAFHISARTESFLIEGAALEHDLVPVISADNISGGTTAPYVFALDFEKSPLHVNADYGLSLQTEPIEIVYQEHAYSEIAAFFHCQNWDGKDLKELLHRNLNQLQQVGKDAVKYAISAQKKFHISVDLKSPYLIIPEYGTSQKGGNVLVLDFGRLRIQSDLQNAINSAEDITRTELEERLYDRYHVTVSDVQILFADSGDEWRAGRLISDSESHLMPKLSVELTLANSVKPEYRQLPKQKFNVIVPSIKLNLSDRRIRQISEFVQIIPLPATRRVFASSNSTDDQIDLERIDKSRMVWEPSVNQLITTHRRLLKIVGERERALEEADGGSPGQTATSMQRQPSDVLLSPHDYSDEEHEEWARVVDLPGFDDNVSPNNTISILLRFSIGEIVLQLARSSDHIDKPYLMLRAEKLCMDTAFMEYGPAVQASLGTFQLVDKLHMGTTGEYLELITSIGATETISVLYRKVQSSCPDFKSHFHNVEQSLVLTVGTIVTTFHRGAFITLHKFLQYVIERISIKGCNLKPLFRLSTDPTQFLPIYAKDPPVPQGATKFSISARLDEIKIKLCDSDLDLMEARIAGMEADVVMKANEKLVLRSYLTFLSIDDLSDTTLYSKILSLEDDKVFDFKYVRHSSSHSKQQLIQEVSAIKCDASIRLRIGRMQFCVLYKFMNDVQKFLEPFVRPELTNCATKAAEKAIQEQIIGYRNCITRVNLSIDIQAPIVLIPQKSDSPNLLVARLGDLSLENFFKEAKHINGSTNEHLIDNILVRLNSVQMNRAVITLDGHMEEMETIVEPVRLRLDIKRSVPPFVRDILIYDIRGNLDTVKINIGQRDLGLLLAIIKENATEGQFFEDTSVGKSDYRFVLWFDYLTEGTRTPYSPIFTPSPTSGAEDQVGRKLQAFFNTSMDIYKEANFTFTIEGAQLTFYYDSVEVLSTASRGEQFGLSRLEMDEASLSIEVLSDKSLEMKCALQCLSLEDIRQENQLAITKIFQSYSGDNKVDMGMSSVCTISMPPMIDVTYKRAQSGDAAIDILIEKTRLNLSVPYVLSLAQYLYEAWPTDSAVDGGIVNQGFAGEMYIQGKSLVEGSTTSRRHRHASSSDSTSGYHSSAASTLVDDVPGLTITAKLKKPEVVLFADPTNKNSHVLVLKADVFFDYSRMARQESLSASVAGMQLLSCVYGQRRQTAYLVLQPCDMEFSKCTTFSDDTTIVRAKVGTVDFRLSDSTVHTIRDVVTELMEYIQCNKETYTASSFIEEKELQDLWATKKILQQKWVDRIEEEGDTNLRSIYPASKVKENFFLTIPSIQLVCELEEYRHHLPVIMLRMGLDVEAHDWSKLMYAKAESRLELSYYNENLTTWEPLIEPVMTSENSYRPWEILIKVFRQPSRLISSNVDNDTILSMETVCGPYSALRSQTISESSSSGEDTESEKDMTIIKKPSAVRLKKIHAQKSYDTSSLVGYTMDSDSENEEGVLDKLAAAFGHMFSSDNSEDESESEKEKQVVKSEDEEADEEDEEEATESGDDEPPEATAVSPGMGEKPIFLAKQGTEGGDSVDSVGEETSSQLATYVVIDSRDKLNFTITPTAINVITDVIHAFSVKTQMHRFLNQQLALSNPLEALNMLGPQSTVTVIEKSDRGQSDEDRVMAMATFDEIEQVARSESIGKLIDLSPGDTNLDEDGEEVDRFSISSALTHAINTSLDKKALIYEESDVASLYQEVTRERINIDVPGFDKLQCFMPRRAGSHIFALHPQKNDTRYHIAVNVEMHRGYKRLLVTSPLKIHNCLDLNINVFYQRTVLENLGEPHPHRQTDPFAEKFHLVVVKPNATYHVPLFVAYHCHVFFQVADAGYQVSDNGIWWQEVVASQNVSRLITCAPLQSGSEQPNYVMKVVCSEGEKFKSSVMSGRLIPNFILSVHPPLSLHNNLPYAVELQLENSSQEIKLEPGAMVTLTDANLASAKKLKLEIPNYLGLPWAGSTDLSEDMEDHRMIAMIPELNHGVTENKQLNVNVHVEKLTTLNIYLYSPYWIVNKTGLPLHLRGSGSSTFYETNLTEEPLLFRFRRHRRRKAKMRVYNSRWSASFSLDSIGSRGVIVCKDKERGKKHQFLLNIKLSKMQLTKIITLMPYFVVVNNTKKHLRYMEQNERADFWVDIGPDQSIPLWPDTDSMQMHVKFRDSNIESQAFYIHKVHDTVLRMDHGSALCVSVHGGIELSMTITFYSYAPGTAPVRVENWCEDLFLKIHQKSMGQVALLSPYQSVLYTWDDPTKERTLMWNIYNRNKPGFPAFIGKDCWGQEKVAFHTLRPDNTKAKCRTRHSTQSSTDDDDSDVNDDADLSALSQKTRRDKVIVYWVSHLEGNQRVLLFTQEERVARQARKNIDAARANLEVCVSLGSTSLSLINANCKEVAYVSLSHAPAIWEVEISHRWKMLPLELSAWLEDKWKTDQAKFEMKDYVQVDFNKMQMTKPFFGKLYRRFIPAVWCQYRASESLSYFDFKLHRLQIDNQLPDALFSTVMCPSPVPPFVVRKTGIRPFLEVAVVQRHHPRNTVKTIKYLKVLVQNFNLRVDKAFMESVHEVLESTICKCDLEKSMKEELEEVHSPLIAILNHKPLKPSSNYVFEYIHLSPLKITFSFSSRGPNKSQANIRSGHLSTNVDFLLTTVGATLTEVKDINLRIAYFQRKGLVSSLDRMFGDAYSHFSSQLIQQFYVLVLGMDVLGNPFSLIEDFTQGLGDLFYEPFMGVIKTPEDGAEGVAIGVQGLLGQVAGGTHSSITLIPAAMTQAQAVLSFDEDYKRKRRQRTQLSDYPEALTNASKTLVLGISLSLSGVIVKPVLGITQEGIEGFFKGIGKGLMGLLTKPAGGVVDTVSMAFDGIRRASEMGEDVIMRMRVPRYLNPLQGVRPYLPYQAAGFGLLLQLSKGHYAENDIYWAHAALAKEDGSSIILVSYRHIFELQRSRLWGEWELLWKINIDDIMTVPTISTNKLIIKVRQDESFNLFTDDECFVTCDDPSVLKWLLVKIEKVLIAHMEERPCPTCS